MRQIKFIQAYTGASLFVGLALFCSRFAQAEIGDAFILCKHDKSVRTLRIEAEADNCKAIYTKQGVDQVIGASQSGGACDGYISAVKKTLETAQWNCREVKESRLSNLSTAENP